MKYETTMLDKKLQDTIMTLENQQEVIAELENRLNYVTDKFEN
jgi:hypothetical protein